MPYMITRKCEPAQVSITMELVCQSRILVVVEIIGCQSVTRSDRGRTLQSECVNRHPQGVYEILVICFTLYDYIGRLSYIEFSLWATIHLVII